MMDLKVMVERMANDVQENQVKIQEHEKLIIRNSQNIANTKLTVDSHVTILDNAQATIDLINK